MKIWIYYHIAQLPYWKELVEEKITLMQSHGLWQAADKIVLQMHYDEFEAQDWLDTRPDILNDSRIEIVKHCTRFGVIGIRPSYKGLGEVYSVREMHDDCLAAEENTAVFHFHTKGIRYREEEIVWPRAQKWNRYIEYFNIDRWRLCYEAIKAGYDTVGCNWHNGCWSGTIWWASTDYIKTIPLLKWPHEVDFEKQLGGWAARHDSEHWIGNAPNHRLELHHFEHAIDYRVWPEPEDYELNKDK
jgi:hypothetical protein